MKCSRFLPCQLCPAQGIAAGTPDHRMIYMLAELRWLIGFNLVLSLWLGMLANAWKGRNTVGWFCIGLCTSIFGLIVLALVPKLQPRVE